MAAELHAQVMLVETTRKISTGSFKSPTIFLGYVLALLYVLFAVLPSAAANPGAEALIQWCITQAVPMALVTSSSRESVTYKTAAHPWIDQIKTRVLGDDPALRAGKPAPDPFVLAAQHLGVAPEDCWAFEDSAAGGHAAITAGCQVWILNPNGQNLDLDQLPTGGRWQAINSLNEVLERQQSGNQ